MYGKEGEKEKKEEETLGWVMEGKGDRKIGGIEVGK